MEEAIAAPGFVDLEKKLDCIAVQVQYLSEQAKSAAQRHQERAELVHDALPIANDALDLLTGQLEEIQGYVDLSDLLRLLKRLLRSGRNLDKMLDQLESVMDLTQTVGPLADDMFGRATDMLQRAEQRGYFSAAKAGAHVLDDVVTTLNRPDPAELDKISLWRLMSQLRDPEVQRGLARMLKVVRVIGRQAAGDRQEEDTTIGHS